MNILIIGTTDKLGGAARVSWDIKTALEKAGHEISMFVADKRSNDSKVKVIPRSTWRKYLGFLLATERLVNTDWILETEEFKKADIVHCHNLHGRFFNLETLSKMSRLKPVVWTLHDEWALTPHCAYTLEGTEMSNGLYVCPSKDTQPRILWDNAKRLAEWKTSVYTKISHLQVITPSKWLYERARKTPLSAHTIKHIPNGIDTRVFTQTSKAEARKKLGLPADKKIVLFLATDAKDNTWKGWTYTRQVIDSHADRGDLLFLNVGNLNPHADEKNIKYVGHISNKEEIALYYSAADILLFTSIAENFPLVILEAMSCGLPILAFDVGGVKEVVTHKENGYVSRYMDFADLQRGFKWLTELDNDHINSLSSASSKKIQSCYDVSHMIQGYMDLYHDIYTQDKRIQE